MIIFQNPDATTFDFILLTVEKVNVGNQPYRKNVFPGINMIIFLRLYAMDMSEDTFIVLEKIKYFVRSMVFTVFIEVHVFEKRYDRIISYWRISILYIFLYKTSKCFRFPSTLQIFS
jgi:hypothetical protein